MSQIIIATFEGGVFRPDNPLPLEPGTRVRLSMDVVGEDDAAEDPSAELDRVCAEFPLQAKGMRLTRDQLHERR